VRIGVVRNYAGAGRSAQVETAFAAALDLLRSAGATLVDPVDAYPPPAVEKAELAILLHEFRDGVDRYLADAADAPRSLSAVIEFNSAHPAAVLPFFGQDLLESAEQRSGAGDAEYRAALAAVAAYRGTLEEAFASRRLDALAAPANDRAWPTDPAHGDAFAVGSSSIAALSGRPSVALPIALADSLPLGLALIGRPRADAALLAIAGAVERLRGEFPAPRYVESLE
jgi:amidase